MICACFLFLLSNSEWKSFVPSDSVTGSKGSEGTNSSVMADDDSATPSQSSRSSTPNVSNPGTPRQELSQEVRATPPLTLPSSSAVQRTIPGQSQPPSASTTPSASMTPSMPTTLAAPPAGATAAAAAATAAAAAMATPSPQPQPGVAAMAHQPQSRYSSLLAVIEDMGRDIRPTYAGNRTSSERLKRSIVHARILVRECLMECERSART